MNHDCNGDYSSIEGVQHYRCFGTGSVFPSDVTEHCPKCGRLIKAEFHNDVSLITVTERIVRLPDGHEIMLSRSEINYCPDALSVELSVMTDAQIGYKVRQYATHTDGSDLMVNFPEYDVLPQD